VRRLAALVVGAALLLAACATVPAAGPAAAPANPPPVGVAAPVPEPKTINIPRIAAGGNLIALGLAPDGTLAVPPVEQPLVPAWWDGSPRPGAVGPAVITGHVDGGGRPGIFHRLDELAPGDRVEVGQAGGGVATFEVYRVEQYAKDADAAKVSGRPVFDHEAVYGNTRGPELRLITCGGPFRRGVGHYADNVVAFARLV
jgi:hypothetical protein